MDPSPPDQGVGGIEPESTWKSHAFITKKTVSSQGV